jgi:hypothetical protein
MPYFHFSSIAQNKRVESGEKSYLIYLINLLLKRHKLFSIGMRQIIVRFCPAHPA